MKTIITILLLFIIIKSHAQIPSINETKSKFNKDHYVEKILNERISNLTQESSQKIELGTKYFDSIKNRSYEGYKKYYDAILNQKNDSISNFYYIIKIGNYNKKELDSINKLIDEKNGELLLIITEMNEKLASFDKFPWILPTWKKPNRKKFFHDMYNKKTDQTDYLNSFAFNTNSNATSVQTEIVTDNMWALRISFGSVLSVSSSEKKSDLTPEEKNKHETEEEAFSRLINGGGNFYLEAILPLFSTNQGNGDQITSYTYANLKGAMDIEKFNSGIDTSTGNSSLGLNSYLGISSDSKKFNFFVIGDINYTIGSKAFYNNLGLNEEKAFLNGKFIAGVAILNKFKLSAIINTFGTDEKLRNSKVSVSVQILP